MSSLPIVHRELLVRARQPGTHRARWLAAGLAMLIALPTLLGRFQSPADMGKKLFAGLTVLALAWCLFEGARQTADCLSEEKREGTLGLLFLTDLTGFDVVLGKLAATSLNSFYSLLAIMPVLGLPLLVGGVTGGEFARVTLVLVNTIFLALAMGMWVSSRNREEMRSLFTALGLLAGMVALPLVFDFVLGFWRGPVRVAWLSLTSPGLSWYLAQDVAYRVAARSFWLSVGIIHVLGWGLLLAAAWNVQRGFREEGADVAERTRKTETTSRPSRSARRRRLLEMNPVLWLASRPRGVWLWIWLSAGLMVFGVGAQALILRLLGVRLPMFGWGLWGYLDLTSSLAIRFLIAYLACRFFADARHTGTLEVLLCTPLRREDILRGQRAALWRLLFWPFVLALMLQTALVEGMVLASAPGRNLAVFGFLPNLIVRVALLSVDTLALMWVGMWTALNAKRPATAVARTFVVAAVLPWVVNFWAARLIFVVPFGIFLPGYHWAYPLLQIAPALLIDAALIWWASRRLQAEFCAGEVRLRAGPR